MRSRSTDRGPWLYLCGFVTLLAAGLLVYSQTAAFARDEDFHLLAAQLILHGKRPYLDFFLTQTPLYAYWNAAWMWLFGDTWRTAHVVSALLTSGAIWLTVDYVWRRFGGLSRGLPYALVAAILVGLNTQIIQFGAIGQPYALCLLLMVAAFRAAVVSVDHFGSWRAALTGFFAGAAAAASLLTAPAGPVLLIWMLWHNRAGNRWGKLSAFLAGGAIPFLPLLRLFVQAPRAVFFQAVKFHLFYRDVAWQGATRHNLEVLISWADSTDALLLGLLAALGLAFVAAKSEWEPAHRAEFYLCGWIAMVQTAYLFKAHPTFARYFLFTVPFLGILAVAGLLWMVNGLAMRGGPRWPALALGFVLFANAGKMIYDGRDDRRWSELEQVARKVNEVAPPGTSLWADEAFYFLTRHPPAPGMESQDTHKLTLTASDAAALHVVPESEMKREVSTGAFIAVATCDDDVVEALDLQKYYAQKFEKEECYVYWDWSRPSDNHK